MNMGFATIGAVGEKGVTLLLPGETAPTQKYYAYLKSYTPTKGDRVAVIRYSGTMLVLGKI